MSSVFPKAEEYIVWISRKKCVFFPLKIQRSCVINLVPMVSLPCLAREPENEVGWHYSVKQNFCFCP